MIRSLSKEFSEVVNSDLHLGVGVSMVKQFVENLESVV